MTAHALLWMLAGGFLVSAGALWLHSRTRFTERTWDEVPDFLRPMDPEILRRLFDPNAETRILLYQRQPGRRRAQRVRLELAREYAGRMFHNTRVVYEWSRTEWIDMVRHGLDYDDEVREKILALRKTCILFGMAARVVLVRMWLWSLLGFERWRLLPLPRVAGLRKTGSVDLLEAYERVKAAALDLALVYGEEKNQELKALM